MSTVPATVKLLVRVDQAPIAQDVAAAFARVLGEVWIIDQVGTYRQAAGVWLVAVKVTAPEHELVLDAPIIKAARRAIQSTPHDSLRISMQGGTR